MTSPQQAKGDQWVRDVKGYLRSMGVEVHTLRPGGINDEGDLAVGPFAAEAKAMPNDVARGINEAMAKAYVAAQRTQRLPMGIVKRRNKPTSQGLAVMDLQTFARFLVAAVGRNGEMFPVVEPEPEEAFL
jgi:hypothetical protein